MKNFNFQPIGFFSCDAHYKYERRRQATPEQSPGRPHQISDAENFSFQSRPAGKQPSVQSETPLDTSSGCITLLAGHNFEQALHGLEGFEYIWLIYLLDRNQGWKPMVRPPGFEHKQGVFATRAPYRPNPLGLSALRLHKIEKLNVYVHEHDLLDGTPILDIKPYLPYSDSFPASKTGWREADRKKFKVNFSNQFKMQLIWLEENGLKQLRGFIQEQLQFNPTDNRRKRVRKINPDEFKDLQLNSLRANTASAPIHQQKYILAYRMWRIVFIVEEEQKASATILADSIFSNYSQADLNNPDDPYGDRELHIKFSQEFQGSDQK